MNFFDNIQDTQILRHAAHPFGAFAPAAKIISAGQRAAADLRQRAIARAAVREILG